MKKFLKICDLKFKICNSALSAGGFTLIELLVSVALIAVITAVSIPYFHDFVENQTMVRALEQVRTDLRTAQNRAVSSTDRNLIADGKYGWWGVQFTKDSASYAIVLAESDSSATPPAVGDPTESSRTKQLPGGILTMESEAMNINIWFGMVSGKVYAGQDALADPAYPDNYSISLCFSATTECQAVTVYEGGRIE